MLQEAIKKKELAPVEHSLIDYVSFRKNLYIVPKALAYLIKADNADKLAAKREALEMKVRGKNCPPPVDTWEQCGLSDRVLKQLYGAYGNDSAPFAVQKQAIPAIMSGRDVIGIAKTGSGKTLGYALPVIEKYRSEGYFEKKARGRKPIVIVIVPTRELVI